MINIVILWDFELFKKYEKYLMIGERKSFLDKLYKKWKSKNVNNFIYYQYLIDFIKYNEDWKTDKLSFEEIIRDETPNVFFAKYFWTF
jgi:hypothetical protein